MSEQLTREQVAKNKAVAVLRRAELAHKLSVAVHEACQSRCPHDIGLTLMAIIDKHYGTVVVLELGSEIDTPPTSERIKALWQLAVEKGNTNSSFPALCRDWLRLMEENESLRKSQTAAPPRGEE